MLGYPTQFLILHLLILNKKIDRVG